MPADTPTAGIPAHAVKDFSWDCNQWGTRTTYWRAQCGATGHMLGRFLRAGSCRKLELCPACFPGRDHNACGMARPVELTSKEWALTLAP